MSWFFGIIITLHIRIFYSREKEENMREDFDKSGSVKNALHLLETYIEK